MASKGTPNIQLWEGVGLGLIIEYPSGVLYSNQTGGTTCLHPQAEGVFVPLRGEVEVESNALLSPETELYAYFASPPHSGTGATGGLASADVDFIAAVLAKYRLDRTIALNMDKLRDSHEAWVHVLVNGDGGFECFSGFEPYPRTGILTWTNSD